jgi:hypothetical protein
MLDEDKTDLNEDVIEAAKIEECANERRKWWIHLARRVRRRRNGRKPPQRMLCDVLMAVTYQIVVLDFSRSGYLYVTVKV